MRLSTARNMLSLGKKCPMKLFDVYSQSPPIRISIWDLRSENPYHEANSEVSAEDVFLFSDDVAMPSTVAKIWSKERKY